MPPRAKKPAFTGTSRIVNGKTIPFAWKPWKFWSHFGKHPEGVDKACWREIVGVPSIEPPDYEQRSYKVIQEGVGYSSDTAKHGKAEVFVDTQLVKTITNSAANLARFPNVLIRSCFHHHFERNWHKVGEHLEDPEVLLERYRISYMKRRQIKHGDKYKWHKK